MRTSSTTRPGRAAIITTRLDRNTASWIECVTKITVSFFLRHSVEQVGVELVARDLVERAEGLVHQQQVRLRSTRPRAIDTRICMPPDSARGSAPRTSSGRPAPAPRRRAHRPRLARHAGQIQRQAHVGLHAGPGHQRGRLEHEGHACCPLSSSCATGLRHSSRRPSVGSSRPATIFSSVLLPQPEGPEQRDELAFVDGQVHRLQRLRAVRVGLLGRQHLDRAAR